MKSVFYAIGGFIAFFVIVYGLGFVFTGGDFWMYQFWAPKYANVQRQVYENTNSYTRGTANNLRNELDQYYNTKDPDAKEGIRQIILHEVADFDLSKLPYDLQQKVIQFQNEESK